ncbi:MAG: hypothetical protein WAV31_02340 [Candidatus Moraniibacteriota bacterium]
MAENIFKKGDKVRFDPKKCEEAKQKNLPIWQYIKKMSRNKTHSIFKVLVDGNIYLEDYPGVLIHSSLFYHYICIACRKKKVYMENKRFNMCYGCAVIHKDQMRDAFSKTLSDEQLMLFQNYERAAYVVTAMLILNDDMESLELDNAD